MQAERAQLYNFHAQEEGSILLLSETVSVDLTSEISGSGRLFETTYLDIQVIFRAILLDFSIKKS